MPSSQDIANDAAASFAAYPELATKIDDGTTVPDSQLDRWIGASYANFVDGCLEQINEVFVGSRAISGRLRVAAAPASGWNGDSDNLVMGDGAGSVGASLYLGPAGSGGIAWRTAASNNDAAVSYNVASSCMVIGVGRSLAGQHGNIDLMRDASEGTLQPRTSGQSTDLGTDGTRWRDLAIKRHAYIDEETAPVTPSSGAVLYVDSADGALKVKFSTGTVVTLGTP